MVNVKKGVLVECYDDNSGHDNSIAQVIVVPPPVYRISDPAMKQFLLHLDETHALGQKFILQDLDETHLFISADIVETLQARVDDLMDQLSIPVHDKGL